jgi:hypothetical protein
MTHSRIKLLKLIVYLLPAIMLYSFLKNTFPAGTPEMPTEPSFAIEETEALLTEPTTAPTEPSTEPSTEPPFPLHCGIREDGTFDAGTLFIGDSLTYGLALNYLTPNHLLGDAGYISVPGAPVKSFFSWAYLNSSKYPGCTNIREFYGMNLSQAVEEVGDSVNAVYYMMGTNYDEECGASNYIEIIDFILEKCPHATFYLQTIPMVRDNKIPYEQVNLIIQEVYDYYQLQDNPRVILIDTHASIGENQIHDGIHLNGNGQALWYEALVRFARENQLPQ